MIGKAVFSRLTNTSEISELIDTRVYPELSPEQRDFPCVVYDVQEASTQHTYDATAGLKPYTVQLIVIARTLAEVDELSARIITAIDQQDGNWGGVMVDAAFVENTNSDTVTVGDANSVRYHLKEIDTLIWA